MPREIRELIGFKFGNITVVRKSEEKNKDGKTQWLCHCDCGNDFILSNSRIGKLQFCSKTCKIRNALISPSLIGQKFNKLTVTERMETDGFGQQKWKCVCECGKETIVTSNLLKHKNRPTKSCGCLKDRENLVGNTFGSWTVLEGAGKDKSNNIMWLCKCECGVQRAVYGSFLRTGRSTSCGCKQRELTSKKFTTHGHSKGKIKSSEYSTWEAMKQRCFNPNNNAYKNYGARGITVCDRWKDSFENFLSDMGKKPNNDLSIERIDNEKGYFPENCKWATKAEQSKNKRFYYRYGTKQYTIMGATKTLREWCDHCRISVNTVRSRMVRGQTIEQALFLTEAPKTTTF